MGRRAQATVGTHFKGEIMRLKVKNNNKLFVGFFIFVLDPFFAQPGSMTSAIIIYLISCFCKIHFFPVCLNLLIQTLLLP